MRKVGTVVLGLALGGVLAGGGVALASSAQPHITSAETITVHEHDSQSTFVDVNHNHRPDPGDAFLFAGALSNPRTHKVVGSVEGKCTVMFGQNDLCEAQATLNGRGTVEVSVGAGNVRDFDAGVIGGTGLYQNARGEAHIHNVSNSDSIITLHLIP